MGSGAVARKTEKAIFAASRASEHDNTSRGGMRKQGWYYLPIRLTSLVNRRADAHLDDNLGLAIQ